MMCPPRRMLLSGFMYLFTSLLERKAGADVDGVGDGLVPNI